MSKLSTDTGKSMNHVFQNAKDKNVKTYIAFGKAADSKLYYESTYTTQVTEEDMLYAFTRGMLLINDDGAFKVAVEAKDNKCKTLKMAGASGSQVMQFNEWAAKASA